MASKFFGWGRRPPDARQCILELDECVLLLVGRQKLLERRLDEVVAAARELGRRNRRLALAELRKKHRLESDILRLVSIRVSVEEQKWALESAQIYHTVIRAMTAASAAMQCMVNAASVDKAEHVISELRELHDDSASITSLLAEPLAPLDDDALEHELDALIALDDAPAPSVSAPSIPPPVASSSSAVPAALQIPASASRPAKRVPQLA